MLEKGVSDGAYDDYIVELKQDTYMEHDPSKNCRNYPNQRFQSYNHCDKDFTLRTPQKALKPSKRALESAKQMKTQSQQRSGKSVEGLSNGGP